MEEVGIKVDSKIESLPHMFSSPEFHKPNLKFRYVISYANCSPKPVAVKISLALKAIYSEISRYSNMLFQRRLVGGVIRGRWVRAPDGLRGFGGGPQPPEAKPGDLGP